MREISLEDLHAELLRIKILNVEADSRLDDLLEQVARDVEQAEESRPAGMEPERMKPLSEWWDIYSDLKAYIDQ